MANTPSSQPYEALPRREEADMTDLNYHREEHDQPFDPSTFSLDPFSLPAGAASPTPRFLGHAASADGYNRDSYASSQHTALPSGASSEFGGSVYALNPDTGGAYRDDPNAPSRFSNYYADEEHEMPPRGGDRNLAEKRATYAGMAVGRKGRSARWLLIGLGVLIVIILAVIVPIYFTVIRPKSNAASGSSSDSASADTGGGKKGSAALAAVSGGDGSTVTFDDGSSAKYTNQFGGTWFYDVNDPYKSASQAQSYTPPLNQSWNWGVDRIFGVNLGGWLVPEPFIVPALFEPYLNDPDPALDEWTLSEKLKANNALQSTLEKHYQTFVTEQDFAEIAGAGLNWIRLPIPYWAIETRDSEPFLAQVSWGYILKAFAWARKYGLRINLDLHTLPGSQNGWNHSGRLGQTNMLLGPMGMANAQRSLDYIRIFAEFVAQDQYKDVVQMFGITNEPQGNDIGQDVLGSYYMQAYNVVRTASGFGQGSGPWISFHDGFISPDKWNGFLNGADRISLDMHKYIAFTDQHADPISTYAQTPCNIYAGDGGINATVDNFGSAVNIGEWSLATTDCGLFVNGVGNGTRYEGQYPAPYNTPVGNCANDWLNWDKWTDGQKNDYKNFAMGQMDTFHDWFFWTWKIGESSKTNRVEAPHWSYKLGLENNWMPKDPRQAVGYCTSNIHPIQNTPSSKGTSGTIVDSEKAKYPWPPAQISKAGAPDQLPQYTPTGTVVTLKGGPTAMASVSVTGSASVPSATKTADPGSGWKNSGDSAGMMVAKGGCSYLDPWAGTAAAIPQPLCTS